MANVAVWIIVSGFAGFIASKLVNKSGAGLFTDIALGIVGGFAGSFLVSHLPGVSVAGRPAGFIGELAEVLTAIAAAGLAILLYSALFRRRTAV